jgi:multiple sugar transport system ATP-binding protein
MSSITFSHVTKRFETVVAVEDFTLEIPDKEFLVLVGPSGCGKSTTLRLLAGLEEITEGDIYIGDRLVNNLAARDRDLAMVFQSYALYPHMSVYDNMAFGLSLRKVPADDIRRRVQEAAQILGIEDLLKRKPRQLSGGQRQRVAVGRAIVREPAAFLFDEPLSNLDAKLRVQTRAELSKLHQRLGATFVYVTHDQVEAMTMATRIAVMKDGILLQVGTPQELYDRPENVFVAGFIGSPAMNFFDVTVKGNGDEMHLDADAFRVDVPSEKRAGLAAYVGKQIIFGIRPEGIHDPEYPRPGVVPVSVEGTVDALELMGNETFLYMLCGDKACLARVDPRTKARAGQQVEVAFDMSQMHAFDPETEQAISLAPAA